MARQRYTCSKTFNLLGINHNSILGRVIKRLAQWLKNVRVLRITLLEFPDTQLNTIVYKQLEACDLCYGLFKMAIKRLEMLALCFHSYQLAPSQPR